MTRVVVVSAGLSVPSSTRLLADRIGAAVQDSVGDARLEVVELRPLAHDLADRLVTGFASGGLATALDAVRRADALVVVTPVFAASYSGLFKTFFDVVEPDALTGTPVLLAATAGSARHSLVIDHALRPLFSYLHAQVVSTGVFAATDDFGRDADLSGRIARAAGELASLLGATGTRAPVAPIRAEIGDLGEPAPFEELLRRAGA